MIIKKIIINNFRNIEHCIIEPNKEINVFHGKNANGKTSLIESIYTVANLKSFRTVNLNEVINLNSSESSINCIIENNSFEQRLDLSIKKTKKEFKKNGKNLKIADYLWSLFSIVFVPDDINFVNGSPGMRRDLIDKAIFFTDINYINILKKYNKIVANKNVNLRNGKFSEIENWNTLIAKYSSLIVSSRNSYIDRINKIFSEFFSDFSFSFEICKSLALNEFDLQSYFLKELNNNIEKEIKYKHSLVGAHRQDVDFNINGISLKSFGSQGQKRSFVLLFRASQIVDFENTHNHQPVLLLDDMAGELDDLNKNIFFNVLNNFSGQKFITTTEKNDFFNSSSVGYFFVEGGKIFPSS